MKHSNLTLKKKLYFAPVFKNSKTKTRKTDESILA